MAWKQDLAKLKQQLGPEDQVAPAPKPPPKAPPTPKGPAALDDEDAVFLSAMGLKPAPPKAPKAAVPPPPGSAAPAPEPASAPAPPETFEEALRDLKGLKPLAKGLPEQAPPKPAAAPAKPAPPPPAQTTPAPPVAPDPPRIPEPAPPQAPAPIPPTRFQLAAGMALEVDGVLDLRGHSPEDALERLKDRLGDGLVLGWRSLQVLLGPDPRLHEGLLALLASGDAPMVARYAQAPVPMGGSQAWLLYFAVPAAPSRPE